ncbi:hypothetical protein B0T25DRAFT_586420 [Lasiosphaeria hispida]|uniref:GIT Spa2 homology (SHD) domain-containing protein n=1 Tax=Lasiosphaeria hispida TaxID=260671 RepID=A0AAJ0H5H2_9PEZI|nr:hypothetical protein B0T25DRAFT_586420 [Lasiosphaeria hispida]
MRLVPLSITGAIHGLIGTGRLNIELCTYTAEESPDHPHILSRTHFECLTTQIALAKLDLAFVETEVDCHGPSANSMAKGRDKLNVHQFITVLGEGVMAFNELMCFLSATGRRNMCFNSALLNAIARLQDFRSCIHLVLNILQDISPADDAITSLTTATTLLLNNPTLTRRLPTPCPLTLDNLPPGEIPVPVYAKDIPHSAHFYHFGLDISQTPAPTRPASEPTVQATESDLLALFNAAMRGRSKPMGSEAGGKERLQRLTAGQFRRLCRDVYDELVRRSGEAGVSGPAPPVPPVQGFHCGLRKYLTKTKLAGVDGEGFAALVGDVWGELGRRVKGKTAEEPDVNLGREEIPSSWTARREEHRSARCEPAEWDY